MITLWVVVIVFLVTSMLFGLSANTYWWEALIAAALFAGVALLFLVMWNSYVVGRSCYVAGYADYIYNPGTTSYCTQFVSGTQILVPLE